jgi:hypothetical protein
MVHRSLYALGIVALCLIGIALIVGGPLDIPILGVIVAFGLPVTLIALVAAFVYSESKVSK